MWGDEHATTPAQRTDRDASRTDPDVWDLHNLKDKRCLLRRSTHDTHIDISYACCARGNRCCACSGHSEFVPEKRGRRGAQQQINAMAGRGAGGCLDIVYVHSTFGQERLRGVDQCPRSTQGKGFRVDEERPLTVAEFERSRINFKR